MVCVNDTIFSWHDVTSGMPQESNHVPVLFLLYVNDLPDIVASNVYMFADGTNIYHPTMSHEYNTILQNELDCLQSWSNKWIVNFHHHNCMFMSITRVTTCIHSIAHYDWNSLDSNY